jgi:ribose-phosphate pyrophosphokinase
MKFNQSLRSETNLTPGPILLKGDGLQNGLLTSMPGDQNQLTLSGLPGGIPVIASCRSGNLLAQKVVAQLRNQIDTLVYLPNIDFSFSDSETCVRLASEVSGLPVFLFQSLYDPTSPRMVDQNYMAFLLAARTFKEWGASSVTGIVPYLAYARQNHPTQGQREPVTASLMADFSAAAGLDRLITFMPHTEEIAAFYKNVAIEQINAVSFFASAFARFYDLPDTILVAPDAGAVPFVTAVGRALKLKCAVGSKFRPHAEECVLSEIIGNFNGINTALVLDDIVSSGGTTYKLIRSLQVDKGVKQIYLGAAHNLCLAAAHERLLELNARYGLEGVVFTNSIPQTDNFTGLPFVEIVDLSDLLTRQIWDSLNHLSGSF